MEARRALKTLDADALERPAVVTSDDDILDDEQLHLLKVLLLRQQADELAGREATQVGAMPGDQARGRVDDQVAWQPEHFNDHLRRVLELAYGPIRHPGVVASPGQKHDAPLPSICRCTLSPLSRWQGHPGPTSNKHRAGVRALLSQVVDPRAEIAMDQIEAQLVL